MTHTITAEEYNRLPDATHPPQTEWRLPQFDVSSEIDYDQARTVTYRRARLWIRQDERANSLESPPKKMVQVVLTLDRSIIEQYPVDRLAEMLKLQMVEAFVESVK